MEQREKLIELLKLSSLDPADDAMMGQHDAEYYADYLLANGVVVLPCRCGDCEHWGKHDDVDSPGETDKVKACGWAFWMVGENGYCIYAKPKGGDE